MRPPRLAPLFATVRSLKGVGPKVEALLNKLVAPRHAGAHARVIDLLWHLPVAVIDRALSPRIAEAKIGELATLEVTIAEHRPGGGRRGARAPYKVLVEDMSGAALELVYFNADPTYLKRLLPVGAKRLVSGKLEAYDGWLQMPHPDHVVAIDAAPDGGPGPLPLHEPLYPLTAGLTNSVLRKAIGEALARLPSLPEWIDEAFRVRNGWPSFAEALARVHAPESEADLAPSTPARARLAYDELLANQLALAIIRQRMTKRAGRRLAAPGKLRKAILAKLPFKLTGAQTRALGEIDADLASPHRMLRLLQGDVGSGKTVVALLALAGAVEAGAQGALMAPTELLARQHLKTISELGAGAGLRIALLTGRERGREREAILASLQDGGIDILIGTHAIFQEPIAFRDLGLVVIDEQHRFGVHQRLALQGKGSGSGAELLVMTATPIPRTLLLTSYGDMDVSRLDEKPPGRKPVATANVPLERLDEVIARVGARDRLRHASLLGLPPGRRVRAARPRRGRSPPRGPHQALRRARRAGAWQACRQGEGSRDGGVRLGRALDPGLDHRHRGRRRCAERLDHDHRACRALRARPAASAARPRRTGRQGVRPASCSTASLCRRRHASA